MFGKVFDMDNGFWRFMNRVADICILNVICLICCIPIVTIGASITAMYTITLKMVRNEESYIVKGFWQAFKSNFKQSTIIWLIMLALGLFLGADIYLTQHIESSFMNTLFYVFIVIAVIYVIILSYIFPLESKFINTIGNSFKNALLMGIAHLLPWTLIIIVLNALPIVLFVFFTGIFLAYIFPIMLLAGAATIAYLNSMIFNRIFKRYIPGENGEEEAKEPIDQELSEETISETSETE